MMKLACIGLIRRKEFNTSARDCDTLIIKNNGPLIGKELFVLILYLQWQGLKLSTWYFLFQIKLRLNMSRHTSGALKRKGKQKRQED